MDKDKMTSESTMHNGPEPILSVRNLKTYFFQDEGTVHAVDGTNFELHPGKTLGIVGELSLIHI